MIRSLIFHSTLRMTRPFILQATFGNTVLLLQLALMIGNSICGCITDRMWVICSNVDRLVVNVIEIINAVISFIRGEKQKQMARISKQINSDFDESDSEGVNNKKCPRPDLESAF